MRLCLCECQCVGSRSVLRLVCKYMCVFVCVWKRGCVSKGNAVCSKLGNKSKSQFLFDKLVFVVLAIACYDTAESLWHHQHEVCQGETHIQSFTDPGCKQTLFLRLLSKPNCSELKSKGITLTSEVEEELKVHFCVNICFCVINYTELLIFSIFSKTRTFFSFYSLKNSFKSLNQTSRWEKKYYLFS